jgi:hypothetical protein
MARRVRLRRRDRRARRDRTPYPAALGIGAAAILALAPLPAAWVDRWFSGGAYAVLQPALTSAASLLPVALLDLLVAGAAVWLGLAIVRIVRARGARVGELGTQVWRTLALAAIVYLVFLGLWGLNYRRPPITARLDYQASRVTPDAVASLARQSVRELNRLHPRAHEALAAAPGLEAVRLRLVPGFVRAQRAVGMEWAAAAGRPKHPLVSPFFGWAAIDGMINPFGLEVLLNPELLPVERPAALAHEWGHLAGWARESEASYLAWLTCQAGDEAAQYSGWLALYWHLRADLPQAARAEIEQALAAGPREDLAAIAARVTGGHAIVQQASWQAYDRFLKANRVEEGVGSYSEVVRLVVGTRAESFAAGVSSPR